MHDSLANHELEGFRHPEDDGLDLAGVGASLTDQYARGADPYGDPNDLSAEGTAVVSDGLASTESADVAISPRSILEAILFVGHPSNEPIRSRYLAALMRGVRPAEIDGWIRELNEEYTASGCPYEVASVDDGYRMALRPAFQHVHLAFQGRIREAKLSQTAIDLLAIVAYRQPIDRSEIERSCDSANSSLLAQLVRRGLLSVEKSPQQGKHSIYRTTDRFLALFGLASLDELPQWQGSDPP